MWLKFSELLPLSGSEHSHQASGGSTSHGHDLKHRLSNEFCKGTCKPVGRIVFLERAAEFDAHRTPLHYFIKAKAVLPHNGQKGCNTSRSLLAGSQIRERTAWKRGSHVSADPAYTLLEHLHCVHKGYCWSLWGQKMLLSSSHRPWVWGACFSVIPILQWCRRAWHLHVEGMQKGCFPQHAC